MIFQDPMTALNPVMTIGKQISEVIAVHEKVSSAEAEEKMKSMLTMVGIDPQRRGLSSSIFWRHEAKGGYRHCFGLQSQSARRRRTDHGPGCNDTGAGAGSDKESARETRYVLAFDYP